MSTKPTEEFKRDAVRMALTSGLPRKQLAGNTPPLPQAGDEHGTR